MQSFDYCAVSSFQERPSENVRYLIKRQLPKLIDLAISEALEFINTIQTKGKGLQQLKYTVLIAESAIEPHLQKIIKALVKIWQMEIDNVQAIIKEIMAIIGYFVGSSFYLPLMMEILRQDEIKNSPKNTIILLNLISNMLKTSEGLQDHLRQITKIISQYEEQFIENDEGLATVKQIAETLIRRLNNFEEFNLVSILFSVLLNVQSAKTMPQSSRSEAEKSMELLAQKSGYSSVADLHSAQVGPVLTRIIETKDYINWNKTSKNRFKFDTIVKNCKGYAKNFLNEILTIIEACISIDSDIEVRMDTMVLVEQMITQGQLQSFLFQYGARIIRNILLTAIKWKVGKPQIKIRKAGMINLIKLIQNQLVTSEELLDSFDAILPHLKTCISDDWAPQLRLTCCEFLEKYLLATGQTIDVDKLKDLYVILLERLDDSQDPIRLKITIPINLFFMAKYLVISPSVSSTLEYMINAIFVHYDDNNSEIREAINVSLRFAAKVDPEKVLKSAKLNLEKMKHKDLCKELIQFCEELLAQRQ